MSEDAKDDTERVVVELETDELGAALSILLPALDQPEVADWSIEKPDCTNDDGSGGEER